MENIESEKTSCTAGSSKTITCAQPCTVLPTAQIAFADDNHGLEAGTGTEGTVADFSAAAERDMCADAAWTLAEEADENAGAHAASAVPLGLKLVHLSHDQLMLGANYFCAHLRKYVRGELPVLRGRCRDVLPLPLPSFPELAINTDMTSERRSAAEVLVVHAAAGLNFLYNGQRDRAIPRNATALHRHVFRTLFHKATVILEVLEPACLDISCKGAFAALFGGSSDGKYPDLRSDAVDILDKCGLLNPQPCLDRSAREIVESASLLFGDSADRLPKRCRFAAGSRTEYCRLVVRQLQAGKVIMLLSVITILLNLPFGRVRKTKTKRLPYGENLPKDIKMNHGLVVMIC